MKIVHIITGLEDGGAEAMLYRLVLSTPEYSHCVISLSGLGKYGALLGAHEVPVADLKMATSPLSFIKTIFRLRRLLRKEAPHVVQTWMYHADLLGGIAARLAGIRFVIWCLHNGSVSPQHNPPARLRVVRAVARLSQLLPDVIVSCSRTALEAHKSVGYAAGKLVFIANGYATDQFYPDSRARQKLREDLGVTPDVFLLGMVARLDRHKDHLNLLKALEILRTQISFRCLLVGSGLGVDSALIGEIVGRHLEQNVVLVGPRPDVPMIMNALDVHVLSSLSEAFPNVLCEAMSCGTPCVTTDVGDSAYIVGETGWVVPASAPDLLAAALLSASEGARNCGRKAAARARIVENFSIERMRDAYIALWRQGK